MHDLDGNRIAEYDYNPTTQVSTLLREYIWMNGTAVAVVENGEVFYIRTDHIGRPIFATDDTGTKVWEASYLPFGGVHISTGANIALRFPGQWFQSESGLHQNWMRDYDPATGRYMQADPLGLVDGASVYGYARQNPGRYVDFKGEETQVLISTPKGGVGFGHASIILPDMIYDPNGSCSCQFDELGGPFPSGSGDTYIRNTRTDAAFFRYQSSPDFNTYLHNFDTSPEEEQRIKDRIRQMGGGGLLGCANSVSHALDGIGPFGNLGTTNWPTRLNIWLLRLNGN